MSVQYFDDKDFKGTDFSENEIPKGEYENCAFDHCLFTNSDLSEIRFVECSFKHCDFTMAKLSDTAFRTVKFKGCKLLGIHFEDCNQFLLAMDFENCQLNLSSFYKLNLKNSKFTACSLRETDFTESDLTGSKLCKCDLNGAIFDNTRLEKADLRTAYNFSIDPENNRIRKAKFSLEGTRGLLDKYNLEIE